MVEESLHPRGGVHAVHQAAGVHLGPGVGHRTAGGRLLQGHEQLLLLPGGVEAQADLYHALVGDGVLTDAAGDFAAVEQPSGLQVVAGLQLHHLAGGLQNGGAALFRGVARVGGHPVDGEAHRPAALAAHHKVVVQIAGLEVEGGQAPQGLLLHGLLGVGEHMQVLLVPGENALDGPLLPACGGQSPDGVQGDDQAGLHVQHAGAVGEALLVHPEGIFLHGAVGKHGVHVAQEEQGSSAALPVPLAHQHPAGVFHGDHTGTHPHVLHLPAENVGHLGYSIQVAGAALGVDQLLPQLEHGLLVFVHIAADHFIDLFHIDLLRVWLTAG